MIVHGRSGSWRTNALADDRLFLNTLVAMLHIADGDALAEYAGSPRRVTCSSSVAILPENADGPSIQSWRVARGSTYPFQHGYVVIVLDSQDPRLKSLSWKRRLMSSQVALRPGKPHKRGGLWTSISDSTGRTPPRLGRINGQHGARSGSPRDKAMGIVVDSYNSGTVQLSKGNLEEAEILLMETISRHPAFEKAWNNLGVCLMRKRVYEKADRCFHKALSIDPSYEIARLNLEECKFLQVVKQL